MHPEAVDEQLEEFERQLSMLPQTKQPPPTTLQVLGRANRERDWQRLLFHLLSANESHGLDHNLLEHFLVGLEQHDSLDFSFSRLDLDSVQVAREIPTEQGRPDLVVWLEEDWFVLFELKVSAAEGDDQTERYANIDSFDQINVEVDSVDDERRHYVYLAPESADGPSHSDFEHVSWEWVADRLQSFLHDGYGAYPTRTTAQIEDFADTIRSELTMTEYQQNQREKMALYVQYNEAISEAESAFEEVWNDFEDEWGEDLASAIDGGESVEKTGIPEQYVAFEFDDEDDARWIFRQTHSDWAWIFKDGWWRQAKTGESVYDYDSSRPDTRVGFLHRLEKHREDAVKDGNLKFFLRNAPPNVDVFTDAFVGKFNDEGEERERIRDAKPDGMRFTDNTQMLLEGSYKIDTRSGEDFLAAYIGALAEAFVDNVVNHGELVEAIDDYYEESFAAIDRTV